MKSRIIISVSLKTVFFMILLAAFLAPTIAAPPHQDQVFMSNLTDLRWVDYSPTHYDPNAGVVPTDADIKDDLKVLYDAGFQGIVTYGSSGVLAHIPSIARQVGLKAVIMGIWAPDDTTEVANAVQAAPDVDGYVVGNEGISAGRYTFSVLEKVVNDLRAKTGKPVTTTEIISLYESKPELIQLGDWVFANAHPYWQQIWDPREAVTWTEDAFNKLQAQAGNKLVVLKEVGLPSASNPALNEYQQAEYYDRLRETSVHFVYFEAFDQTWKHEDNNGEDSGPHWGLFQSDRTPKTIANYITMGHPPIYVYADGGAPQNHFVPEGWMGCTTGIDIDENDETNPHLGASAIRVTYKPDPKCNDKFGGIYWWNPPGGNWCSVPGGFDLSGWTMITFLARGDLGGETAEFKVGGLKTDKGGEMRFNDQAINHWYPKTD